MVKNCNCKHPKKHGFKEEVIRVPKVYDWATDSIKVKKEVFFGEEERCAIEEALEDPRRRPLRIVAKAPKTPPIFPLKHSDPKHHDHDKDFFCEQIGEKREVVVPINGEFVDAEEVDLLFNATIEIEVLDRHGCLVTEACVDVSVIDTFVLCYPDGTDLLCRIQKILAEVTSDTILLNGRVPRSFMLEVTFCADVQVEAEVKLEVLGKFASPRENNLEAIESEKEVCPPISFPNQCPDIFPVHHERCEAKGEASGFTPTCPHGKAGILVHLNSQDLDDGRFDFTFEPRSDDDDEEGFTFVATHFDENSLDCDHFKNGRKLEVKGSGHTEDHKKLDFRLALVDSPEGDQFQVQFTDPKHHNEVFNSGCVNVKEGNIEIKH